MSEWKSSDGGSVTPLGSSAYSAAPGTPEVIIVTGAANVKGVVVRTAFIDEPNGATGNWTALRMDGKNILTARDNGAKGLQLSREIFVPPGQTIAAESTSIGIVMMTYDIL